MKLYISEETRKLIAQELMDEPLGVARDDYDELRYAKQIAEYGEMLAGAVRDGEGRLDLPAEVWQAVIDLLENPYRDGYRVGEGGAR